MVRSSVTITRPDFSLEKFPLVKFITLAAILLVCNFAHAQEPAASDPNAPVVDLGDIVANVVIATVKQSEAEPELIIVKFGRPLKPGKTKKVTVFRNEVRTRRAVVDGKAVEVPYTVNIPETTEVADPNFTPTEKSRSVPIGSVQAFDINGSVVDLEDWTKTLEVPTHVLLIKTPMSETQRLNPFFAQILREDILLLYLKNIPIEKKED